MEFFRPWQRAIAAIATAKVFLALGVYATVAAQGGIPARDARFVAFILVFASLAFLLLGAGRRDLRAQCLGVTFLLTSAVFADTAAIVPRADTSAIARTLRPFFALQVDAFTGYFLWFFVLEFPRAVAFGPRRSVPRRGMQIALFIGVSLFAMNIIDVLAATA